ncbi:MAG: type II secretion system protein M [Steroidobacteraceae bacterium]
MKRSDPIVWYNSLAARDRRILRFGAIGVLLIILVWVFVPLQHRLSEARARLQKQQADIAWMQQVAPTLAAAGPGPVATVTQESLVVLIDRSARESGLAESLAGSQPATNGAMRVQLEHADFNLLTGWLSRLSAQHGVRVEAASITAGNTPGLVNASVQLRTR